MFNFESMTFQSLLNMCDIKNQFDLLILIHHFEL